MDDQGTMQMKVMIAGGGTGGHLFPGIAVAEELRRRHPEGGVVFVTTGKNLESDSLKSRKLPALKIRSQGIKGKGIGKKIKAVLQLPLSLFDAMGVIRGFGPCLVFGVGGYVTGPVLLAARCMGITTCIHEQNSVPGVTNKMLGRIANLVFLSIPGSEKFFAAEKVVMTGNPVRSELIEAAVEGKIFNRPTLLVLGGSQGAHRLNTLVLGALEKLHNKLPADIHIIHQTGVKDEKMVREAYGQLGLSAEVASFFHDMAACYKNADLVVSRAGATTLAELTVMGKPSILIPFPFATDDHQSKNALFLVEAGAARMVVEEEVTDIALGEEMIGLLEDGEMLQRMKEKATGLARPEAVKDIVDACEALLAGKRCGAKSVGMKRVILP
jgi:UDP-N-acetylglucosamine--N-acetylmuramyl-(pentapeptide) pyrophosphoryl-undecaprenol N-acetylglucosamine transferase